MTAGMPIEGRRRVRLVAARRRLRRLSPGRRTRSDPWRLALATERLRLLAARDHADRHGTAGSNGWYVSDVSVSFDVQDPESAVASQVGCDPTTVTSDAAALSIVCEATSAGGTSARSAIVNRDVTPPTVTCPSPAPVFQLYQLGAWVTATVTDATSGRATAPAQGITNTNTPGTFTTAVTGADRAGNRTTVLCSYQVVVPSCNGLTPTRVGTALNDVINGTSARDVIVGLGGADTIKSLGGDDVICGGDGPDTVDGGDGKDWINGEASPDDLSGGNGDDFLDGGLHNDSLRGGNGTDTCVSGEERTQQLRAVGVR